MIEKAGCGNANIIRALILAFSFAVPVHCVFAQRRDYVETWQQQESDRIERHLEYDDHEREQLRQDFTKELDSVRESQQKMEVRVEGDEKYVAGGAGIFGALIGSGILAWYVVRVLGERLRRS